MFFWTSSMLRVGGHESSPWQLFWGLQLSRITFPAKKKKKNQLSSVILQPNGAPALNDEFIGRCIGCGSKIVWPPRSLDLTTCDNLLWSIVKEGISYLCPTTVEDLKTAVRGCFYDLQPSTWKMSRRTWRKIQICFENGGKHTDKL